MHRDNPEDILDIHGLHAPRPLRGSRHGCGDAAAARPPWKMVWFQCCHVYGRIHRNPQRTQYAGRCPRCAARVTATIGPGGTSQKMFRAK